ncbi:MAG: hypothetical protein JST93_11490 [Acidobacteria bacterium]|nr:hypothetical protein [Acidobacteriota bacterium]
MFFLEGPNFSSPFGLVTSPTLQWVVNTAWVTNVDMFFADVAASGITNIVPTPSFTDIVTENVPGKSVYLDAPVRSSGCEPSGTGQLINLLFNVTAPWGFEPYGNGHVPHGRENAAAYNCSPQNPRFVGWPLIVGVGGIFDKLLEKAQNRGLWVLAFDIQNETNVHWTTVMARLIYDNTTGTNVLNEVQNRMQAHNFNRDRVVYSSAGVPPDWQYVPTTSHYTDVAADHFAGYSLDLMYQDGDIPWPGLGCFTSNSFCPSSQLKRSEAAVLIVRSIYRGDAFPDAATNYFPNDVPYWHQHYRWIQKLRQLGITMGCGTDAFCPDDYVSNGQLAVMAVRAWQILDRGEVDNNFTYNGPQVYGDVPPSHVFFKWIHKAYELRIMESSTQECGYWIYCPDIAASRGKASLFMVRGIKQKFRNEAFRCVSVYGDDARFVSLSATTNALKGRPFGMPPSEGSEHFQNCYGQRSADFIDSRVMLPIVATQPLVVDAHLRPAMLGSEAESVVYAESQQTFDSMYVFLRDNYQIFWPEVLLGEAWNPKNSQCNNTPDNPAVRQPPNATANTIAGFNASWLASQVWFTYTPWATHTDASGCEPLPTLPWFLPPIAPTLF